MKILTEEQVKFKDVKHYYSLKNRFPRGSVEYNRYEDKYRGPRSIGFVSALFKRLRPQTYEEAFEMYINSGKNEKHRLITERGRDYDELEALAIEWKDWSHSNFPLVDFYDTLVLHAVIETFDGLRKEEEVYKAFQGLGYDVTYTEGKLDSDLGVDIVASKGDKKYLVQVKVMSYFFGKTPRLPKDRAHVCSEEAKEGRKKAFGEDAIFVWYIYDGRTGLWAENDDGTSAFSLEELMNPDGTISNNIIGGFKKENVLILKD